MTTVNKEKDQPKNQHFLPKMFLKGFTNNQDQVFMVDKDRDYEVKGPRNLDSVAREKHLYTVGSGEDRNYTVEKGFRNPENKAVPLFSKIITDDFRNILDDDVSDLIDFIALTSSRIPLSVEISEEVIRDQNVTSKMKENDPEEAERYIQECLDRKGLSYAITLQHHLQHRRTVLIENFDLVLSTLNASSDPLLITDRFMFLELLQGPLPDTSKDINWADVNAKKHFPVSNRHCVSFVPKEDRSRVGTSEIVYVKSTMSSGRVQILNRLNFNQLGRYAYCSDRLILDVLMQEKNGS